MIAPDTATPIAKTHHLPAARPAAIERDAQGVWQVNGYAEAKAILLAETRQAGFKVELMDKAPALMKRPILFQDGPEHHEQRAQTAKFFTPTITNNHHLPIMEKYAAEIVGAFERRGQADLNYMAAQMAMRVVAEIVGLTASSAENMLRNLGAILHAPLDWQRLTPRTLWSYLQVQYYLLGFLFQDVKPAIAARRKTPRDDLISHLLTKNYRDSEILAECIVYGAAGMVTTQEFICVVAWHLLENATLRADYLAAEQPARYRLLHEFLRVEPVVGYLYRRALSDLTLQTESGPVTIPAGASIQLQVRLINADERVVAAQSARVLLGRKLEKGLSPSLAAFGLGPHRCAGEFIAIAETDVFLRCLFTAGEITIAQAPTLGWNNTIKGYELRNFILSLKHPM